MSLLAGKCRQGIQAQMRGNDLIISGYCELTQRAESVRIFLHAGGVIVVLSSCKTLTGWAIYINVQKRVKVMSLPFLGLFVWKYCFWSLWVLNIFLKPQLREKRREAVPSTFPCRVGSLKNNIKYPVRCQTSYSSDYANPFAQVGTFLHDNNNRYRLL